VPTQSSAKRWQILAAKSLKKSLKESDFDLKSTSNLHFDGKNFSPEQL
jgi:hypothetical protein